MSHGFWLCPLNTDMVPGSALNHSAIRATPETLTVLHLDLAEFLADGNDKAWQCGKRKAGRRPQREAFLPALAPATALEMALLEIALFRFMISSNSASLTAEGGGPESRLHRSDTSVTATPLLTFTTLCNTTLGMMLSCDFLYGFCLVTCFVCSCSPQRQGLCHILG